MRPRDRLASQFADRRPAEAAAVLDRLPTEDVALFLSGIDSVAAAGVVRMMGAMTAAQALEGMDREAAERVLDAVSDHRCAVLLRALDATRRRALADVVPTARRKRILRLVSFPAHTAGALAETPDVVLRGELAALDAMPAVVGRAEAEFWVIDDDDRLLGMVSRETLSGIVGAGPRVAELVWPTAATVPAAAPAASVLRLAVWYERDVLPVVDARREFIGVLSHRTLRQATAQTAPGPASAGSNLGLWLDLGEAYWSGLTAVLSAAAGTNPRREEEDGHGT
jgi:magnesium transporter